MSNDVHVTGAPQEDVHKLAALVAEQADQLALMQAQLSRTLKQRVDRSRWLRALALVATAGTFAFAASASAAAKTNGPAPSIPASGVFTACYGTKTTVKFLTTPLRILDTRNGTGVTSAGARPAGTTTIVSTSSAIPGAIGVIGNITVTGVGSPGFLTVFPSGGAPNASTIDFDTGWTIANHVQSGLSGDGTFRIYNLVSADIVFDVTAGIYPVSKGLRLIDTSLGETCAADETQTTWNQTGPQGSQGIQGSPGVSGWHIAETANTTLNAGARLGHFVQCGAGEKVFGGGAQVVGEGAGPFNLAIAESAPGTVGNPTVYGWYTSIGNFENVNHTIHFYAVCGNAN